MRSSDDVKPRRCFVLVHPSYRFRSMVMEDVLAEVQANDIHFVVYAKSMPLWVKAYANITLIEGPYQVEDCVKALKSFDVVALASYDEFAVEFAEDVRVALKLPSSGRIHDVRNKLRFREMCIKCGIEAPRFRHITQMADVQDFSYPAVLKPVKGAGSYFVRLCNSVAEAEEELGPCLRALQSSGFENDIIHAGFILEEFIEGAEVDIDGFSLDGKVVFGLISDNFPAALPGFQELGGVYPSQLPPHIQDALFAKLADVVKTFEYSGCFHFEAKVRSDGTVLPIEMNPRIGGAECPSALRTCADINMGRIFARHALGLPVEQGVNIKQVVCSANVHCDDPGVVTLVEECSIGAAAQVADCCFFRTRGEIIPPMNGSQSCICWYTVTQSFT
eukprot:GEMP01007192.1.p1 GENE.GEMP01007192.1~~GEMP01007192.1.p1  ORF type:complete len:390 (+),score=47.13 GEMP01007192.1:107-1276(+)